VTAGEARYQVQGAFEDNKNTFQLAQTDTIWGEVTFHLGSIIIRTAASLGEEIISPEHKFIHNRTAASDFWLVALHNCFLLELSGRKKFNLVD